MEVSLPKTFFGLQIGLRRTLVVGWLAPVVEVMLENQASQLQTLLKKDPSKNYLFWPREKIS
jgi:hypothetical protein